MLRQVAGSQSDQVFAGKLDKTLSVAIEIKPAMRMGNPYFSMALSAFKYKAYASICYRTSDTLRREQNHGAARLVLHLSDGNLLFIGFS